MPRRTEELFSSALLTAAFAAVLLSACEKAPPRMYRPFPTPSPDTLLAHPELNLETVERNTNGSATMSFTPEGQTAIEKGWKPSIADLSAYPPAVLAQIGREVNPEACQEAFYSTYAAFDKTSLFRIDGVMRDPLASKEMRIIVPVECYDFSWNDFSLISDARPLPKLPFNLLKFAEKHWWQTLGILLAVFAPYLWIERKKDVKRLLNKGCLAGGGEVIAHILLQFIIGALAGPGELGVIALQLWWLKNVDGKKR